MAVEVIVRNRSVPEIMSIVQELRDQGLKQEVDFDFAYNPPIWDTFSMDLDPVREKHTVFTFYTEKYSTLFAIKYGS